MEDPQEFVQGFKGKINVASEDGLINQDTASLIVSKLDNLVGHYCSEINALEETNNGLFNDNIAIQRQLNAMELDNKKFQQQLIALQSQYMALQREIKGNPTISNDVKDRLKETVMTTSSVMNGKVAQMVRQLEPTKTSNLTTQVNNATRVLSVPQMPVRNDSMFGRLRNAVVSSFDLVLAFYGSILNSTIRAIILVFETIFLTIIMGFKIINYTIYYGSLLFGAFMLFAFVTDPVIRQAVNDVIIELKDKALM